MLELTPIFVLGIIFSFLYAVIFLNIRRKERMMLLEKGADPSIFKEEKMEKVTALKWGLFMIGIAVGILLGNVLVVSTSLEPEVSYFSMVFLFGGLSLVISHFVGKKMEHKQ
jgi:predicted MFS family arabinose efflux permease